jgi:hypothetical protein
MLLTDFCNRLTTRAPVNPSIPEREDFAFADLHRALLRSHLSGGPQRISRRRHHAALRRTRSRVDVRLTSPIELRLHSLTAARSFLRRAERRSGRRSRCLGFFDLGKVGDGRL